MISSLLVAVLLFAQAPPAQAAPASERQSGGAARPAAAAATEKAKEAELTDGQLVTKALASAAAGLPCEFTSERVVLWFDAKGKVACRGGVPPLATGATLEACVLVADKMKSKYRVYVTFAKPNDEGLAVRAAPTGGGEASLTRITGHFVEGKVCVQEREERDATSPAVAASVTSPSRIEVASGELTVHVESGGIPTSAGGDVSTATAFPVARRYHVNVGLLGTVGKQETAYTVRNQQVAADPSRSPLKFYLTFHAYPLAAGASRFFGDGAALYGDRRNGERGLSRPRSTKAVRWASGSSGPATEAVTSCSSTAMTWTRSWWSYGTRAPRRAGNGSPSTS